MYFRDAARRLLAIALALIALAPLPIAAAAPEPTERLTPVRVQLKWLHQFQFAGFYAAIEKGFYRDAGLDVTLIEANPQRSATEAVLGGEAEFGVSNSSLVIDRSGGSDVVVVAPMFQHSPFVLIARRGPDIESVHDLAGTRIMVEADAAETLAYLRRAGIAANAFESVPHEGDPLALRDAGIDAATAYTSTEPYYLIKAGVPFQVFNPRELGINFYGDTVFTAGQIARERPDLVRGFRDATLAGWHYALAHTDEIIEVILDRYAPHLNRRALEFEAEDIKRLMIADVVDLGYASMHRWQHIAEVFDSVGMMEGEVRFDDFLFDFDRRVELRWLVAPGFLAVATISLLGWTSHRFYSMTRALRREITHRHELEGELLRMATTDELTGLPNRRHFFDEGERAFEQAVRDSRPLSIILLDIDRFKDINDSWGHQAGDRALREVAAAFGSAMPEGACLARLGGEEFAAMLPDTELRVAAVYAERIQHAFKSLCINNEEGDGFGVTASIGAVCLAASDADFDALLARADRAMYRAKQAGRNRVRAEFAA